MQETEGKKDLACIAKRVSTVTEAMTKAIFRVYRKNNRPNIHGIGVHLRTDTAFVSHAIFISATIYITITSTITP